MKTIGVLIAFAVIAVGGWLGYDRYVAADKGSGFVTKALDRGDIVRTVAATGTIEPLVKVIVGSQVSGKIKKWYADFNAEVKENDILAEIDPDRFQTAFDQSRADLAFAKAREEELRVKYNDLERERKRIQALREKNNASENEYLVALAAAEGAAAAWHGAEAGVLSAEASLSAAKVDLDRTVIRSPISGVVIARNIEDGQTVAASLQAPELFIIANDLRRMQVNANVSEADIGLIRERSPATFRVDAFPTRIFSGIISQIRYNATIVDGVVTYVTLIEVSNDDSVLRPGMTANVTFEVARASGVLRIPNAALRFDPNPPEPAEMAGKRRAGPKKPAVWVLAGDKPVKREIEPGLSDGAFTEFKGGELQEKDAIIVERNWQAGGGRSSDMTRTMRQG